VDENTDEESTFQIVGADESDIKAGLLSVDAPLARALISKSAGDTVEVSTPSGFKSYEILKVQYR
jgi:transcription elongation factor GreA